MNDMKRIAIALALSAAATSALAQGATFDARGRIVPCVDQAGCTIFPPQGEAWNVHPLPGGRDGGVAEGRRMSDLFIQCHVNHVEAACAELKQ
jgi:hypothetical protein